MRDHNTHSHGGIFVVGGERRGGGREDAGRRAIVRPGVRDRLADVAGDGGPRNVAGRERNAENAPAKRAR